MLNRDISGELINTFLIFIELGNISRAADRLGLSQPAITNQLKRFESSFPLPVFTFEGRKKVLTNYGIAIHQVLHKVEEERKVKISHVNAQYLTSEKLMLRVGLRKELAWRTMSRLNYDGPVEIVESSGTDALEMLAERRLDIAVTQERPRFDNVITIPIMQDHTQIIVHQDWAKQYGSQWYNSEKFLQEVPVLFYKSRPPFLPSWYKHCNVNFNTIKPRLICDDWPLIIRGVEEKQGYCIIPDDFKFNEDKLTTYVIPEEIVPSTQFYAYFFPELTSIPAFGPLINSLRNRSLS